MGIQQVEQAIGIVKAHPEWARFVGGASSSLIAQAESLLTLSFPPTYKHFLKQLGAGSFAGSEFYGICGEDMLTPGLPNAIWFTLDERHSGRLPGSLVLVHDTGDGAFYAIDTSGVRIGTEAAIVLWTPGFAGHDSTRPICAPDFGVLFHRKIIESIEQTDAPPQ